MSHFTHMKTRFQNLLYLEKALNRLNITHKEKEKTNNNFDSQSENKNLVISQSNGYDIEFNCFSYNCYFKFACCKICLILPFAENISRKSHVAGLPKSCSHESTCL